MWNFHGLILRVNPITGGGGGERIGPRLVFLLSTENGLRWGLEISWLFLHIHWECCTKFLSFYFAQRRLQDHFLGEHVCQVLDNFFFKFSEIVKTWLCVMDLFIEKLVLKFGRNRSRNNEVMTILNIWWKKRRILFLAPWTPNLRIFWIFENVSCSSRWGKSNGVYPIEIGLTVLEISMGGRIGPPHQLTSSRKPTSNRVKLRHGLSLLSRKVKKCDTCQRWEDAKMWRQFRNTSFSKKVANLPHSPSWCTIDWPINTW